ncbi:MAG: hypothetical protein K2J70_04635 [Muribaculaceae bacterium]|nr:hypothetical protein [Muribaculaceae bacterium]
MREKEEIREQDYQETALKQGGELIPGVEIPAATEDNSSGTSDSEEGSGGAEDKPASAEAERMAKIDIYFSDYPQTRQLLEDDKEFKVDAATENFMASVSGFARGRGCVPEVLDSAMTMLFEIAGGRGRRGLTIDMVETLMKGLDYDKRLAEEVRAAELRGRNANIEARMQTPEKGDGLPHLQSKGELKESRNRGIFSLIDDAR